jgi:uncharacterized coiled-coil DUF342 family protein
MAKRRKPADDSGDLPRGPELVLMRLSEGELAERRDRLIGVCIELKRTRKDQSSALKAYRDRINGLEDEMDRITDAIASGQEEREHPTLPMMGG